jgi:hypothetical protein
LGYKNIDFVRKYPPYRRKYKTPVKHAVCGYERIKIRRAKKAEKVGAE